MTKTQKRAALSAQDKATLRCEYAAWKLKFRKTGEVDAQQRAGGPWHRLYSRAQAELHLGYLYGYVRRS